MRTEVPPLGYELFVADLERQLAARVREVNAYDLHPMLLVTHGASIYDDILGVARKREPI